MAENYYIETGEEFRCDACSAKERFLKLYDHHDVSVNTGNLAANVKKYHDFPGYLFKGCIAVCSSCGYGKMLSPPSGEELESYYKALFWKQREVRVDQAREGVVSRNHQLRSEHQIEMAMRFKSANNVFQTLEIGAGEAFASQCLKTINEDIRTCICEAGAQWDSHYESLGLEKIAGYFPFSGDEKFDLIIASHWLEHVLDVQAVLTAIREKLKPDGLLVIDVPNTQYDYWDVPERDIPHIHFFTPESLVKLSENSRLKCRAVESYGISIMQRQAGIEIQPEDFAENKRGYGIRAVFSPA